MQAFTQIPPEEDELIFTPPHNTEAEQAVIGSILLNNELWHEHNLYNTISSTDFYNIQHQIIFESIADIINSDRKADLITLTEELTKLDNLDKIGGKAYLVEIMSNSPSSFNVKDYAEIIRTKSIMRQLYDIGQKISQLAYTPANKTSKDILDEAEQLVFNIAEQSQRAKAGLMPIQNVLLTVNEGLESLYNSPNQGITGVETGFYDLDKKTSGLQAGDLIIIAGRPSMGKTSFAMNIAEYVAVELKKPVAIFSMEMPAHQLATRMISSLGGIELSKLKTGQFEEQDWDKFSHIFPRLNSAPLFIDESGGLSALEIKAKIRRLKRAQPDLSLVVIDYIQLMSGSGKSDNRTAELGEISRSLKTLAKEINAPIIVLSQLSRGVESRTNKRPMMSDLRDSGAIEQDADLIIFMYRDSYYNHETDGPAIATINSEAEAIIGKHRNGPIGTINLIFQNEFTKFVNATKNDYDFIE
ncbi:replicative DNA helicase [Neisseriaceae bacterium PsAf]|nr:replicative DNA helicase [Neisseriaceae bacterium PsAf]MCV2503775.1 replicative DNA helicase [Neisseriaceae bacterium]